MEDEYTLTRARGSKRMFWEETTAHAKPEMERAGHTEEQSKVLGGWRGHRAGKGMGAVWSARWGRVTGFTLYFDCKERREELYAGKGVAFWKGHSDFCLKNGLEEEGRLPVRGLCKWSMEMMAQLWGGAGGGKHGNIQEMNVRSWNRWFLMDWVKVLRKRETSGMTLGFWLEPWDR